MNKLIIAEGALEDSAQDKRYWEYMSSQKKDRPTEKSFLYMVGLVSEDYSTIFYNSLLAQFYKLNLLTIAIGRVCSESI